MHQTGRSKNVKSGRSSFDCPLFGRPLFITRIVQCHSSDRPLRFLTVNFCSKDRLLQSINVHFDWNERPLSRDRSLLGPSTLDLKHLNYIF